MKMLPKNDMDSAGNNPITTGAVIMYEHQDTAILGVVQRFHQNKFGIINERGRELDLPASRLHLLPEKLKTETTSNADKAAALAILHQQAEQALTAISLDEVWSFVVDEQCEFTSGALVELYFGKDTQIEHVALRLALLDDRIYFKRKREFFIPRPPEIVEELKQAEATRQVQQQKRERMVAVLKERIVNPQRELPDEVIEQLELLADLAAGARSLNPGTIKTARELLESCKQDLALELSAIKDRQAYLLLRKLGYLNENSNLALIRHKPPLAYSPEAITAATEIKTSGITEGLNKLPQRLDFTNIPALTIDDVNTTDMDDALSVERTSEGYLIGIHISDVASTIAPDSLLDQCARERATSLYFPDRVVHMLPDEIAADYCSLVPGQVRPCISCLIEVGSDLSIRSSRVAITSIRSVQRYSYDEVDRLLEERDWTFETLYQIAEHHRFERLDAGALHLPKKAPQLSISPSGSITLKMVDEDSPAHALVGELMVIANRTFAEYCGQYNLPAVFRAQNDRNNPPTEAELNTIPAGPARDYASRQGLQPSRTVFSAEPHAALGLQAYLQATSPIRRYADLCNQRQILAHLTTEAPCYNAQQLENVIAQTDVPLQIASAVRKESQRFWLLRYLQQQCRQNPIIEATVLRVDLKRPLIELDNTGITTIMNLGRPIERGDRLRLRIKRVNPAYDELRLEEVV